MNNKFTPASIAKVVFIALFLSPLVIGAAYFILSPFEKTILFFGAFFLLLAIFVKTEHAALALLASCAIMRFPGATRYMEIYRLIFAGIVISIWFLKKLAYSQLSDKYRFDKNILSVPIAVFVFILLLSYLNSANIILSGRHFLIHLVCLFSLFMFCDLSKDKKFRKKVVICLFAMAVFSSFVAILQYLIMQFNMFLSLENLLIPTPERREFIAEAGFKLLAFRSMGTFLHPNLLGMFLAMVFPLAFALLAYLHRKNEKLLLWSFIVLVVIAVFCCNSRGSILSMITCILFIAAMDIKRAYRALFILLFSAVILFSLFSKEILVYMRLTQILSYRDIIWSNGIKLFLEKWFLGYGLGSFPIEYLKKFGIFSISHMESMVYDLIHYGGIIGDELFLPLMAGLTAHNLFLNYAVETGFLGPVVLFWFYITYFKWAFLHLNRVMAGYSKAVLLGVTAAVLGNFIHSFFEATTMFSILSIGIPFMSIISLAFNEYMFPERSRY